VVRAAVVHGQGTFVRALRKELASRDIALAGVASSASNALAVVDEFGPQVLVFDLGLCQAFEGLRQVRERRPDVQVLAVTSDHASADRTEAVELGVTAFVRSDATANEVADALELVAAASAAGLLSPARPTRLQAT
jgi:DNA-binding NarL/FixJ family response regulator